MKKYPFHPFLFVIFPLLSLYVSNINQLGFSDVLLTILIALIGGAIFWFAVNQVIRNMAKSAFLASIFLLFFFSFRSFIYGMLLAAFSIGIYWKIRYVFENVIWLAIWWVFLQTLWLVIAWRVQKWKMDTGRLTLLMNFVSIVLVLSVSFYWIETLFEARSDSKMTQSEFAEKWNHQVATEINLEKSDFNPLPDIYYIILDGYARQDVLKEKYQADNTPFIEFLKQKGFFVAEKATSNYKSTALSLSSSLNYMYLDGAVHQLGKGLSNENFLKTLIDRNRVFAQFRANGYQIVTFSTGYDITNLTSADLVLEAGTTPNNFESTLIGNTPLSIFLLGNQYQWHREKIQYTLSHIPDASAYTRPTFVFAHVLAPHPPFVFGAHGEPIYPNRIFSMVDANDFLVTGTPEEYQKGYTDQLAYINSQVQISVQKILDESKTPPIIIIQSDHGPGMGLDHQFMELSDLHERLSILNAYYLPGGKTDQLYSSITPVNSFRVVLNEYFGANFPLLEDRNYYSSNLDLTNFTDITNKVQSKP